MNRQSAIEALESRIAPAVTIVNHPFDIIAGIGSTGATIDLGKMVDATTSYRTLVEFTTNYTDPGTHEPAKIVIELFDDKAPVTVANFLSYVNGTNGTDYDGTFFHRIADFGANSEPGTDIIQAGGFDVSNIFKHIPTTATVHNEYNADDPEVQNIRGTIAMAKTGLGPNTGSSEWFFNLTNNTSILGETNNGGFTGFGRVVEGLSVIDAIGAAEKISKGGALNELPVQDNYVSGTPKAAQLFQIVDAKVLETTASNLNDHTFGEPEVYKPGSTTEKSNLLTATIDPGTHKLTLSYTPGKIGQAEVWIPVTKDGQTVTEKFLVTVEPNLLSEVTTHKLPTAFVPGDQGVAKVKITNNLGGVADGKVKVRLYLSEVKADGNGDGLPDAPSFTVDAADVLLGEATFDVKIASGDSTTLSVPYFVKDVVNEVALINGKQYVVVSQVVPAENSDIVEVFSDDNDGARLTGHTYTQGFGNLSGRKNAVMTIETPDGDVSFKLTGGGSGTFTRDADGGIDITLSGTSLSSTLSVKAESGTAHIDDLLLSAVMGNVKLGNAVLHGDFMAQAGVKSVSFGALGTAGSAVDHSFSINGLPGVAPKLNLSLGNVWDYSITSNVAIGRLTASSWLDTTGTAENQIFTPQLDALKVTGDFEASLLLSTEAKVAQITVGGTLRNADLTVFGDIGTVKLGNMVGSTILAGMSTRPDSLGDFALDRTIKSFTVTGTLSDSVIAAANFNTVNLGNVDKAAGTELKGIYADAIKSYARKGVDGTKLTKLDTAGTFDIGTKYEVRVF